MSSQDAEFVALIHSAVAGANETASYLEKAVESSGEYKVVVPKEVLTGVAALIRSVAGLTSKLLEENLNIYDKIDQVVKQMNEDAERRNE